MIVVSSVTHTYPPTRRRVSPAPAVNNVSFAVPAGEMFCLLGPNGSGKSTLFKILSTMISAVSGDVTIDGHNLRTERDQIRSILGVVFQHPSLDDKLTVYENLLFQGQLYALGGRELTSAIDRLLGRVGLAERRHDLVEHLSGGNQRRVELAKALLHAPKVLILDEPSTGLDPVARKEFTLFLRELSRETGVTVLLTTHILDEAERCDRIGIMDSGSLVATGSPTSLKEEIGGEVVVIHADAPEELKTMIESTFATRATIVDGTVRVEHAEGHRLIPQIVESWPGRIGAITLSRPSLEDVFIRHTGHTFTDGENE